jgi:lipoate-protein ligase A
MPSTRWRLILTPPAGGAENMAFDEALMDRARVVDEWVLRVYSWARPTVSLGRNQTAKSQYDLQAIRARGLDVVRRPTGGRAILHDREITYSVTAPVAAAGDLATSYRRINQILVAGLAGMGVAATAAAPAKRAIGPGMSPCFDEPASGELTVSGRKLAGSAQWRSDGALLQHGSILVADDQSALSGLALGAARAIPAPATLSETLGRVPAVAELWEALANAVRTLEDPEATILEPDQELRARAAEFVVRYLDDAWTWRR